VEALHRQLDETRASREMLSSLQRQLLRSREDERSRLARDLHDGPLQTLAGLNMQLGIFLALLEAPHSRADAQDRQTALLALGDDIEGMRLEVRGLLTELRQVCSELRPPMLDMLGLGAAIQALALEWSQQHGIEVNLELPQSGDPPRLPDEVAVNLFRVVQEALTNVARHAQATQVTVSLASGPDCTLLSIQDNGCGFEIAAEAEPPIEGGRFGLLGMRERVALIGGDWTLKSKPGQGTGITVAWPRGS
jgi:signal transduction histidine kinase